MMVFVRRDSALLDVTVTTDTNPYGHNCPICGRRCDCVEYDDKWFCSHCPTKL